MPSLAMTAWLGRPFKHLTILEFLKELLGAGIRRPLHRSFLLFRSCGLEWCMISGSIVETMHSSKHRYPAPERCLIGLSAVREQTDFSVTWSGGPSSTGVATSPLACLPKMRTAVLLRLRFNT